MGDFIGSLQRDDPLAAVTVVGPSRYANLALRHERARAGGFANVQFMVFPRLSELLGARSLTERGHSPLTGALESAAVRSVAERAPERLREVFAHASTQRSLRRTFGQLRYASSEALERLGGQGGLIADVVGMYKLFREETAGFYDREDLALAAAEAVRAGDAPALGDLGFVVIYQPRDVTPAERTLIEALAHAGKCAVFLGLTGDDEADAPARALAGMLLGAFGGQAHESDEPSEATGGEVRLLRAPDPREEIRWIIRDMVRRAERGTPFYRMAILYRNRSLYGPLVREEMELAEIPASGPDTSTLADTTVGRTLVGLMDMSDGEFARDSVMDWLTGCPVRYPAGSGSGFNAVRWDVISKQAGVVRGAEQWTERLTRYADGLEEEADRGEELGEIESYRAVRMREEAASARGLLGFMEGLIGDVSEGEGGRPSDGASWGEFRSWAGGLLDRYLAKGANFPEREESALDKIESALDGMEVAAQLEPHLSFGVFRQALGEALQAQLGHFGVTGQGVFTATVGAAVGMSFDAVYMVGMTEGAFPPATPDDPLAPERARQAAGGSSEGLPTRQAQRSDERYNFLSALACAPDRTFSYPAADPSSQRAHYASRWFLEQASKLEEKRIYASDLDSLSGRDWYEVVPSMEGALVGAVSGPLADIHDYELTRLLAWKRSGKRVGGHPLASSGHLSRALALGRRRYGGGFTEWDGNLSDMADGAKFAARLRDYALSPTRLERWAQCPFSYFMGYVLGIGAMENPEDAYSITPLERGSLVHWILEKFIEKVRDEGGVPAPGEAWGDSHRETLLGVAHAAFEDAESRGVTGKPLMWRMAKRDILDDLDAFLVEDSRLRERFGVSPGHVEARFGIDGGGWQGAEFALPDGSLMKFRGVIDRVDLSSDGKRALVMDYKTGGSWGYRDLSDDPIDKGKRLQLAIYSLAARQALGEDVEVSAAYWFVSNRGGFDLAPKEPLDIGAEGVRERFAEGVSAIVSGIGSGLFPANPGDYGFRGFENCGYCDFDSLCPSRRGALWERKRGHDSLADYRSLSGEEDEG